MSIKLFRRPLNDTGSAPYVKKKYPTIALISWNLKYISIILNNKYYKVLEKKYLPKCEAIQILGLSLKKGFLFKILNTSVIVFERSDYIYFA